MQTAAATRAGTILRHLEELWGLEDQLWGSFTAEDWQSKHGKDWVFADVPYHVAYFDRTVIRAVEMGENLPVAEQKQLYTMRELDQRNIDEFARRPSGQTVEQSIQERRQVRQRFREVLPGLTDEDLRRPAFLPLPGMGWTASEAALAASRAHTWSEFTQLRLRAGRNDPQPSGGVTKAALSFYMNLFPMFMNREAAKGKQFTAVMEFGTAGGGVWSFRVNDGDCRVEEGRAPDADITLRQSPETFVKTLNKMHNPMLAMILGRIRVKGLRKMGTFGKLFADPGPDVRLEPAGRTPAEVASMPLGAGG